MAQNSYSVGIYCRLSKDDKDYYKESASISNQKRLLTEHVEEYGWNLWETYVDDGFSGTNFDRPNFKRMIEDIEKGRINCVVVKDLSRFGRNHVDVGRYMQDYFPEMGVRFIAVQDSYDDGDENFDSYNDFAPFKNLMNEFYPKDVSRKVRAVKRSGAKQGFFMNSKAAYGYEAEQSDLESKLEQWQAELDEQEQHTEDVERFIRKCKQYTDLAELTPTILNDLVSKVFVEAPDKSDGKRKQNIHISYDLLGILPKLNVPTIE